jgi:hypothetical protein
MGKPVAVARAWATSHAGELGALALAVGWFFLLGYRPTLNPTFVSWMFRGDWSTYFWGFAFFRNADWSFPLGAIPELFYPFGSSVGFMDANPWFSLLFRSVSGVLPADFQFWGLWFLLCYALQALFGARIAATFTDDPLQRALGGALFALTPILPARNVHIALCGLFFLTGSLALSLQAPRDRNDALRRVGWTGLLLAWAAGTHGYLSTMLLVLSLAFLAQLWLTDRLLRGWEVLALAAAAVLLVLGVYALFGYIGWRETDLTAEGFGQFSADLLTFVSSQGWSRWIPALGFQPRQHEGFAYLGVGVSALLAVRIALLWKTRRELRSALRRLWPLFAVVVAMAFYALSSRVTYRGELVLNLDSLYEPFSALTGIFRSSGRFAWPLHLLLIAAAVSTCAAVRSRTVGRLLLLAAVILQAAEFDPKRLTFDEVALRPMRHPVWQSLGADYQHLQVVPLHLLWECRYDRKLIDRLLMQAYRNRLTFNSGNYMRKQPEVKRLCEQHLPSGQALDAQTVYVVEREYLADFVARQAVCGKLDGVTICADGRRQTDLIAALRSQPLSL